MSFYQVLFQRQGWRIGSSDSFIPLIPIPRSPVCSSSAGSVYYRNKLHSLGFHCVNLYSGSSASTYVLSLNTSWASFCWGNWQRRKGFAYYGAFPVWYFPHLPVCENLSGRLSLRRQSPTTVTSKWWYRHRLHLRVITDVQAIPGLSLSFWWYLLKFQMRFIA